MANPALREDDYVLGTDETEVGRLRIQHEAWRPMALEAWASAGIAPGSRVIDLGAGPGWAAVDIAELVGPTGSVVAVERSSHFVTMGRAEAARRGLGNIDFVQSDLVTDPLPPGPFDAAWCRWVCSFLSDPQQLIGKIAGALAPGGAVVFHEYGDYASWRYSPHLPLMEEYIRQVMSSWRETGGEPDIALSLPPLLRDHGLEVVSVTPRIFCARPGDALWTWITTFVMSNTRRLAELGTHDQAFLAAVQEELRAAERGESYLLTPLVMEIVARRV